MADPHRHPQRFDAYLPFRATVPDLVQTETHDELVCTCGASEQSAADAMMASVRDRLVSEAGMTLVTENNFLTAAIRALDRLEVRITGIYSDSQDFLVVSERGEWGSASEPVGRFVTRIQCDRVEDGLARTWDVVFARFG